LPYPADEIVLTAEDIEDDTAKELVDKALEEEGLQAGKSYQVDVTLWHETTVDKSDTEAENPEDEEDSEKETKREKIEPTGTVKVTFSGYELEDYDLKIYHIEDEADEDSTSAKDMEAEINDDGDAEVDAEHFSTFVIAGTTYHVDDDHLLKAGRLDYKYLDEGMSGNYQLVGDTWCSFSININGDTVIDLNGHGFYYKGDSYLFNVGKDVKLVITDTSDTKKVDVISVGDGKLYGNSSTMEIASEKDEYGNAKVERLTYYVTDSQPDGIKTSESLNKYQVTPAGMLVGNGTNGCQRLIKVSSGGTFELIDGLLTIVNGDKSDEASTIIYNNGTVNISGGYICGGKNSSANGGGIYSSGTLNMTGGVIAANVGTKGGGVYIAEGSTFNMSGGVISGNNASVRANEAGGGGIYNDHGTLNISENAYITNNSYSGEYIDKEQVYDGSTLVTDGDKGRGTHGGGGVASCGGTVTMTGGYVTGNFSNEAGGGMYIGYNGNGADFKMRGGIVASNYCKNSEGGGIRISGGTDGLLEATGSKVVHITNNITDTTNDWGGGGIFIQANGLLTVYSSVITDNSAKGFGGGVAGCPTGTILVVKTKGTAIYKNSADGSNYSGGTGGKADDSNTVGRNSEYAGNIDEEFLDARCYQDYYCVHQEGTSAITMALGEMLGGESAAWVGRCDGQAVSIPKTGYQVANWLCGLTSNAEESAIDKALGLASVYITGNTSNIHGGGIMSNGNLVLGDSKQYDSVCPPLVIKGTKTLNEDTTLDLSTIDMTQFKFVLLGEKPTLVNGKWSYSADNVVGSATADANGKFSLTTDKNYTKDGTYVYYLIEDTGSDINIIYDTTHLYTIEVKIVKDTINVLGVTYTAYRVNDVTVDGKSAMGDVASDDSGDDMEIQLLSLEDETSTQSVSSYTITYDNSETNWSKVYIYTWDDNDKKYTGDWPGTLMTTTDGGKTYTYTLHNVGEKYVIFNNGKHDENDETDTETNQQTENKFIEDIVSDELITKAEKYKIYYDNTASQWEKVYIYTWGVSGTFTGEWPGTEMTDEGNNIFSYELPNRGEKYVIFNDGDGRNNNTQTSDLYIADILENNSTYVSFSASGVDSYTLQLGNAFTNQVMAPLNLKLTKMDSRYADKEFENSVLKGAVFNLYEVNSTAGTDENSTVCYTNNGYSYAVNTTAVGTGTSGDDGVVSFTFKNSDSELETTVQLKRGTTYYLKETTSPNGYEVAGPWIVEVGSAYDGKATIYKATSIINTDTGVETITKDTTDTGTDFTRSGDSLITFMTTISDEATAYELPSTGGDGTLKYTMGGAILIMGAGLLLWYRANKRRKEDIAAR
jgi:LPXTG-motif cell wall-anchored protein